MESYSNKLDNIFKFLIAKKDEFYNKKIQKTNTTLDRAYNAGSHRIYSEVFNFLPHIIDNTQSYNFQGGEIYFDFYNNVVDKLRHKIESRVTEIELVGEVAHRRQTALGKLDACGDILKFINEQQ